jgi:hypothetical protein
MLLLLTLLGGCSKWDDSPVISQLNIVNAYPAAGSLNISINGNPIPALDFGTSSEYIQQRAGRSTIKISKGQIPIASGVIDLAEDQNYSLYILNYLKNTVPTTVVDTVFLRVDSLPVAEVGRAKIRFANLSPDAGTLQLVVNGPTVPSPALPNRTFTVFTPFSTVDAGLGYTFVLRRGEDTLATYPGTQLQSERSYTMMAVGYDAPPPGNSGIMLKLIENR